MRRLITIALMITSTIAWSQSREETIRRAGIGIDDPHTRQVARQKAADRYDRFQQSQQQMNLYQQQMEQQDYYRQENMRLQQDAYAQEKENQIRQQAQEQANRMQQQALANTHSGGITAKSVYKCKDEAGGLLYQDAPCDGQKISDSQSQKKQYTGERLTLDFEDIEIKAVLKIISNFSGVNIVVSDRINGTIRAIDKNIPWDEALDKILNASGLVAVAFNGVLYVGSPGENLGFQ